MIPPYQEAVATTPEFTVSPWSSIHPLLTAVEQARLPARSRPSGLRRFRATSRGNPRGIRTAGTRPAGIWTPHRPDVRSGSRGRRGRRRRTPGGLEGDHLEGAAVRRGQHHRGRRAVVVRLQPPCRADAPPVARAQAGETVLGAGGREVVADLLLVGQEFAGHPRADGVVAEVLRTRVAAAVAVEAGDGVGAALVQVAAEYVAFARHGDSVARTAPWGRSRAMRAGRSRPGPAVRCATRYGRPRPGRTRLPAGPGTAAPASGPARGRTRRW